MKKVTFHFSLFTFNLIHKAYQGLKLLLDPAREGDPYVREIEPVHLANPKRPLFVSRRLGIKGI